MLKFVWLLVVLMLLGPPIVRFDRSPELMFEGSPEFSPSHLFHAAVWLVALVIVTLLFLAKRHRTNLLLARLASRPLSWYAAFGLAAVVSTVYSVYKPYTVFFAAKLWISLLAVGIVAWGISEPASRLLRVLYTAYGIGWVMLIGLYAVDPELVGAYSVRFGYRLNGGFLADYGSFALVSGLACLAAARFAKKPYQRRLGWLLYGFSWVFVLLSKTRSTIAAALFILVVMVVLYSRWRVRVTAATVGLLLALALATSGEGGAVVDFLLRGQDWEELAGLSGRDVAFTFLIGRWRDSPWLGYGFAAGNRYHLLDFVAKTGLGMGIGAAHDAVSKVLVDLGLLGAVVLAGTVASAWIAAFRAVRFFRSHPTRFPVALQYFALLGWLTLASVVSGGVADVSVPFVIVLTGLMTLAEEMRRTPVAGAVLPRRA